MTAKAIVFGCAGPQLSEDERAFFRATQPLGFILFARNVETPDQVRALVADLRGCVDDAKAPILIDQEGGRVARLRPPHWRAAPAAATFGKIYEKDSHAALRLAWLNAALIGLDLLELGITVDCLPLLDVPAPGAHAVIGDRAFSQDPAVVSALGRAARDGLMASGVMAVMKHIPGHGRAQADSHHDLPRVSAKLDDLVAHDFAPFCALSDTPWAMTAHLVFEAVDKDHSATLSGKVIAQVIRKLMKFDGFLVSDDLCMNALSGTQIERALGALAAGCDAVLHCNGVMAEMSGLGEVTPPLTSQALARLARGQTRLAQAHEALDAAALLAEYQALMAEKGGE